MAQTDGFIAATRFGLGARPGDLAAIAATGAHDWLVAQLAAPDPYVEARLASFAPSAASVMQLAEMKATAKDEREDFKEMRRDAFQLEHAAHLEAAASSTMPFRERLVAFWANHLTVSIARKEVTALVGAFEREVVRRKMDGPFAGLLVASAQHPAMLAYLDNNKSVGPDSMAGRRSGHGLNENYARELLELHTLGVDGGYGQADVEGLAKLLTGWTVDIAPASRNWPFGTEGTGGYTFRAERHEPGGQVVLGRRYTDAESAIRDLSVHPSTARHLATKLARHFVADDPPESAIARLSEVFLASGGDLPTVHRALVELPEVWAEPLPKVKTPWDLVLSTTRALGGTDNGEILLRSMRFLGQLPYQAPSPQGWPDRAADWIGPGAVWSRLEWAQEVGRRSTVQAGILAEDVLGPVLRPATRKAIAQAPSHQALVLLLVSPEFQRR